VLLALSVEVNSPPEGVLLRVAVPSWWSVKIKPSRMVPVVFTIESTKGPAVTVKELGVPTPGKGYLVRTGEGGCLPQLDAVDCKLLCSRPGPQRRPRVDWPFYEKSAGRLVGSKIRNGIWNGRK
jgi:hypothetical protein